MPYFADGNPTSDKVARIEKEVRQLNNSHYDNFKPVVARPPIITYRCTENNAIRDAVVPWNQVPWDISINGFVELRDNALKKRDKLR